MCLQAKNILIAVGGRATKLPIPGAEHAIISDDILDLDELPKKLAIVGGGYIALEFAGIYNNFGSETHVVYRQVRLWRYDPAVPPAALCSRRSSAVLRLHYSGLVTRKHATETY